MNPDMRDRSHRLPGLALFLLVLFFLPRPARAAELEAEGTWRRKFQRGVLNTAFAPLEITHALAEENRRDKFPIPWASGLAQGMWFAAIRASVGVYEVVTAPIPSPRRYQPLMLPEFPLEYLDPSKDES